ncbi:MAG: alpha-glucosidase [Spirochaetae bacterium HGW-Spirochaetae-8]|nr:MAG: alpha-glucosidase [Spirochaetae bacterium HGW-Spirochaetae-8]
MPEFTCWWKEGVVYQIYPRSFQDSNGDGIGDIKGIVNRLEYLKWLGVTALWLSPIYQSPMYDFGYDISDYRQIDPAFGTMEDVLVLISKAHGIGIKIIFDMVLNHTSHLHAWFKESAMDMNSSKRDFYIWHENFQDKKPNNWLAAFGGSAWTIHKKSNQYYLHSFLKEQPDLNWRNPAVVDAVFAEVAYWLELGVDGFRLDVINLIGKNELLKNNPLKIGASIRPYDMQNHIFDRNDPVAHIKLAEFRALLERYQDRMLVGEIMVEKPGSPKIAASYLGNGKDELHLAFDFSFIWIRWNAGKWRIAAEKWYACIPNDGWPCWVLSNHDVVRAITRFGNNISKAKIAAMFLLTQKGTPFIYYGEEIGMKDKKLPRKSIQDPVGKRYWPFHPGRDGQRRPMQWNDSHQAGFTSHAAWLPLHREYIDNSVDAQQKDPGSLLNFYKNLIILRNNDIVLRLGDCQYETTDDPDVLCYIRRYFGEYRLILLNFARRKKKISIKTILNNTKRESVSMLFSTESRESENICDGEIKLLGYQGVVLSLK